MCSYKSTSFSTKSAEQSRRSKIIKGSLTDIKFDIEMETTVSQPVLLANSKNKTRLIQLLGDHLTSHGVEVRYAEKDADVLIVTTAIECSVYVMICSK